ncbi:type I restriction enzyme HsdR N-terminal domain-containing protein [Psychroflexus sp. ALD_RP9]|uniref:type I restriction enzyme HsdR N-terminal domain-containing protein n=1 Tax=Psychroflexus sp. ALD_RP9 TaxID=2777186 RepID=UPI001A8FC896|nr:type I restriction enzyme HsdR N-terminal domain-containing protein [Psychroflexus sp. ALD_RP9]QSS96711.1 type I restriction enzyme HsdR N-terminal domain-containing protein [Psychroflexus sp. ALD_RP9]
MQKLNFNKFQFKLKSSENKTFIFSRLRKKYLLLTPEEWVRQHCVEYLVNEKHYSPHLLNEEKLVKLNDIKKRYDVVGFNKSGSIELLVECKAPNVKITQQTFDQIAQYNLKLNATYLWVTNGISHYYCQIDYQNQAYIFLKDLPAYER